MKLTIEGVLLCQVIVSFSEPLKSILELQSLFEDLKNRKHTVLDLCGVRVEKKVAKVTKHNMSKTLNFNSL